MTLVPCCFHNRFQTPYDGFCSPSHLFVNSQSHLLKLPPLSFMLQLHCTDFQSPNFLLSLGLCLRCSPLLGFFSASMLYPFILPAIRSFWIQPSNMASFLPTTLTFLGHSYLLPICSQGTLCLHLRSATPN